MSNNDVGKKFNDWVNWISHVGFSDNSHMEENEAFDSTWRKRDGDPYSTISSSDLDFIEENKENLIGYCSAHLKNGDVLSGHWKKLAGFPGSLRIGSGSYSCASGAVFWGHYSQTGYLEGSGTMFKNNITYKGFFKKGFLHGPLRGFEPLSGKLIWIGKHCHGVPCGLTVHFYEGGGFLAGIVDSNGEFSGSNIAFVYPDKTTCLHGIFEKNKLKSGIESRITDYSFDYQTQELKYIEFKKSDTFSRIYESWPSTLHVMPGPPHLEDIYESQFVTVSSSSLGPHVGDGLFMTTFGVKGTVVAFYNGIRIRSGETPSFKTSGYQIFIDGPHNKQKGSSEAMDIPPKYTSLTNYKATLGHKINHSFSPNCKWDTFVHPCYGRIPSIVLLEDVESGKELTIHYRFDMEAISDDEAYDWYLKEWEKFSYKS